MQRERYLVASDNELIEWALEGDNNAFESLVSRYSEGTHRLLMSRLNTPNISSEVARQDADDLMQECLIKVYINLHRYDSKYTFGQWFYTIAHNTFIDFYRKRNDLLSLDERFALASEELSPNPEQRVINRQKRSQIEACIERLSERHRQLFRLRFLDEYSYEEIAEQLNMPLGTVKTNIHRARTMMCRLITEGEG